MRVEGGGELGFQELYHWSKSGSETSAAKMQAMPLAFSAFVFPCVRMLVAFNSRVARTFVP
jgi:hypothetical protein